MTITDNDNTEAVPTGEIGPGEIRPRPKVGRIPVTLRLLNEEEHGQDSAVWVGSARKSETQFMFFLVTLFVVVNIVLVFLLSYKGNDVAAPSGAIIAAPPVVTSLVVSPLPPAAHIQAVQAAPVNTTELSVKKEALPLPPPSATVLASPTPPVPSVATPLLPTKKSYITPVSPDTSKATSAPFHPVTVTDQHEPQVSSIPSSAAPELKVIQSHNIQSTGALPGLSPAAAAPAQAAQRTESPPVQPPVSAAPVAENPTQDLLSVISKD